jgi:hypothetical protein
MSEIVAADQAAIEATEIPGVKSRNDEAPAPTPTTTPTIPTFQFVEKAQPFHVRVITEKDAFEKMLDAYWAEEEPKLPEHIIRKAQKGFRTADRSRIIQVMGGPTRFYRPAIIDFVNGFKQQHNGAEILIWGDLDFVLQADKYIIDAIVYLEPTVKFKSLLPAAFKVRLPEMTDEIIDRMTDETLEQKREENTILTPVEGTEPANMQQFVVLSGTAKFLDNGERWEPGNFKNKKMLLDGSVPKPILEAVLQARRGMTQVFSAKLTDFQPLDAPDAKDREIKGTVVVHEVFNRQVPEVNDDLAISCSFESLAQMRAHYRREIENNLTSQREQMSMAMVFMQILGAADIGPVPDLWANVKSQEILMEQKRFFKTEEELLKNTGARTVDELLARNSQEIRQTLIRQLALRAYGIQQKIEVGIEGGDTSLAATHEYAAAIQRLILKNLEVEEIEVPKEEPDGTNASVTGG